MLKQLENYYRREGILSTDFRCKHLSECRGGMPLTPEDDSDATGTFTCAKSAFVGDRYGAGVPRLLFVSLDPGSTKTDVLPDGKVITFAPSENRTPESVRRLVMRRLQYIRDGEITGKNSPRLCGTNELAMRILGAFNSEFSEDMELAMRHYAHANSAKCCQNKGADKEQNKRARRQADRKLFNNCRGYLRGEIAVFKPDILITHGGKAKKSVLFAFGGKSHFQSHAKEVALNAFVCELQNLPRFFWLQTPHPSSFGREKFCKQKNGEDGGPGWAGYVELIRAFMNERAGV